MDAIEYNRRQLQRGALSWHDVARLAEYWQEHHGLEVDGCVGPATLSSLRPAPFAGMPVESPSPLALAVVRVAVEELGKGEQGANNSGPDVCRYRGLAYDPDRPITLYGEWCAYFVGWCVAEACRRLDLPDPAWRYWSDHGTRKPVGGAKALVRRAGAAHAYAGRAGVLDVPLIPGDLLSTDRGRAGSPAGHVAIVESFEDGIAQTIEGNVGAFPARVRRFERDVDRIRLEDVARLVSHP